MKHDTTTNHPAVIQVGGTHGSGKSTLVRMALRAFDAPLSPRSGSLAEDPFIRFIAGGTHCSVLGDYSVGTPGADPLMLKYKVEWIFEQLQQEALSHPGHRVIWEIVTMPGIERIKALRDAIGGHYYPLILNVPMEVCFRGQAERRRRRAWAQGREPAPPGENNDKNTRGKIRGHISTLTGIGQPVSMCESRQQGWAHLHKLMTSRDIRATARELADVNKRGEEYVMWVAEETAAAEFRDLAKYDEPKKPGSGGLFG